MITSYMPEMGQEKPKQYDGDVSLAHGGGWRLKTYQTMKGQGIRYWGKDDNGKSIYYLTDRAYKKAKQTMVLAYESLLD